MRKVAEQGSVEAQAVVARLFTVLEQPQAMEESVVRRWLYDGMISGSRVASDDLYGLYRSDYQEARAKLVAASREPLAQLLFTRLLEAVTEGSANAHVDTTLRVCADGMAFIDHLLSPSDSLHMNYPEQLRQDLRGILSRPNAKGETPILVACRAADYRLVEYLLVHADDVSEPGPCGDTPPHWLVKFRNPEEACALARGFAQREVDLRCHTSADCALSGYEQVTNATRHEHLVNSIPGFTTPLLWAIEHDHLPLVQQFFQLDPGVLDTGPRYNNPLAWAAHHQSLQCLEWLCTIRANRSRLNNPDHLGNYPLYYALRPDDVRRLLRCDLRLHRTNCALTRKISSMNEPAAVLPSLREIKERSIVSTLLAGNADLKVSANNAFTALHQAAARTDTCLLSCLLDIVAPQKDPLLSAEAEGFTPCAVAILHGHFECFNLLLNNSGVDLSRGNIITKSHCLHVVALTQSSDPTKFAKAILNVDRQCMVARDKYGDLPLHSAVRSNRADLTGLYLKRAADVRWAGWKGLTPLGAAVESRSIDTVQLLAKEHRERGVPLFARRVPYMSAVEYLLSPARTSGAGPRTRNEYGCFELPFEQLHRLLDCLLLQYRPEVDGLFTRRTLDFDSSHRHDDTSIVLLTPTITGQSGMLEDLISSKHFAPLNYRYFISKAFLQRFCEDGLHIASIEDRRATIKLWQRTYEAHYNEVRAARKTRSWPSAYSWKLYYSIYGNLAYRREAKYDEWRLENPIHRRLKSFEFDPYSSERSHQFRAVIFKRPIPLTVIRAAAVWLLTFLSYVVLVSRKGLSARDTIIAFLGILIVRKYPSYSDYRLKSCRLLCGPFGHTPSV